MVVPELGGAAILDYLPIPEVLGECLCPVRPIEESVPALEPFAPLPKETFALEVPIEFAGEPPIRFPLRAIRVTIPFHYFQDFDFPGFGTRAPSFRAFDRRIATRCRAATFVPNFSFVRASCFGGFAFSSDATPVIIDSESVVAMVESKPSFVLSCQDFPTS